MEGEVIWFDYVNVLAMPLAFVVSVAIASFAYVLRGAR